MYEDTVRLLDECDAGIKMAVAAIDDVLPSVESPRMFSQLNRSRESHLALQEQAHEQLQALRASGKDPGTMARAMSWMKTNARLMVNPGDASVADLIVGGCNMGIKSLHKYQNQYRTADESSKSVADRLIRLEAELAAEMYPYL